MRQQLTETTELHPDPRNRPSRPGRVQGSPELAEAARERPRHLLARRALSADRPAADHFVKSETSGDLFRMRDEVAVLNTRPVSRVLEADAAITRTGPHIAGNPYGSNRRRYNRAN